MKMNKKYIAIITLCVALISPFACSKSFLETTNTFQSTADATFQKSSDVVSLINSIYDTYQNSDLLKKSLWYYANFQTHDWFNWGGDVQWNQYQITPTFGQLPSLWNNAYIGIIRANSAFAIITTAESKGIVTPALADRLRGEAYFLRGMTYYYLAGTFGGVPLELDTLGTASLGLTPRSTQDSVFMQIVSDMQHAETLLDSKTTLPPSELGRATKGAAYGFEGSAQMWLKNYTGALAAFNNPELTSNYHLLPNFIDVGEYDHQNNDESLFEVQFDANGASQSWDGSWQPPGGEIAWIDDFSWPEEITGQGYDYGNPGLWLSYQPGDLRKFATIVGPGDTLISPGIIKKWGGIKGYPVVYTSFAAGNVHYVGDDGKVINTAGALNNPWYGQDGLRTGYFCAKKWRDPNLTGSNADQNGKSNIFGDQNQILLRYAEVLLDRAECKIRTGDIAGGMADIKLVRDRAWGGSSPAVMQDGANYDGTPAAPITDPLQMVYSEYRHELTGEYSLFYDLRRAGAQDAADFVNTTYGTQSNLLPIPNPAPGPTHDGQVHGLYNSALTLTHELLPIPSSAIGLNPNLSQNPGY
jgi:starch-binding outer membrane protein, SusD/RagB family